MEQAEKLMTIAKVRLISQKPFFASLALGMPLIEDDTIKTACTNGEWIKYNPHFVVTKTIPELMFLLAHECMHPAFFHHTRRGNRNPKKWNRAADYAINPILVRDGMTMIEGGLLDFQYENMSTEHIYNIIPDEPEDENPNGGGGDSSCGDVVDADTKGEGDTAEAEAKMKQRLSKAKLVAKQAGMLPANIEKLIDDLLEPKIDWRRELANFLAVKDNTDYTFRKPNPRYLHSGFYLPLMENETVGNLIMIIDTSGSIYAVQEILDQFAGELQEILSQFNKGFQVIYVDTKVHEPQYIEPDEDVKLEIKGGGGTDFRPGFEYIKNEGLEPSAVIYFTDMICWEFPQPPDYPVLWVKYGKFNNKPPFGVVIELD